MDPFDPYSPFKFLIFIILVHIHACMHAYVYNIELNKCMTAIALLLISIIFLCIINLNSVHYNYFTYTTLLSCSFYWILTSNYTTYICVTHRNGRWILHIQGKAQSINLLLPTIYLLTL